MKTASSTPAGQARGPDLSLVFTGNAFERPTHDHVPRRRRRSPPLRVLRALVAWLLAPSPFKSRPRHW